MWKYCAYLFDNIIPNIRLIYCCSHVNAYFLMHCKITSMYLVEFAHDFSICHNASSACAYMITSTQQTQNICITFVQCCSNVFDIGPTLFKCYINVLCLLTAGALYQHGAFAYFLLTIQMTLCIISVICLLSQYFIIARVYCITFITVRQT